jgi:hypothetical protein
MKMSHFAFRRKAKSPPARLERNRVRKNSGGLLSPLNLAYRNDRLAASMSDDGPGAVRGCARNTLRVRYLPVSGFAFSSIYRDFASIRRNPSPSAA